MIGFKTIFSLFIMAISLTFCAMKQEFQTEFPQEIKSVFYQKEKNSAKSSGVYFYIELEKPLAKTVKLEKVYFHNQEAFVKGITSKDFTAYFSSSIAQQDLILHKDPSKEYGNKAPVIQNTKFDLKPNEAVLEYKKDHKTQLFKISNLIEKPLR